MKSQLSAHRTLGCLWFPKFARVLISILLFALAFGASRTTARAVAASLPSTTTTQFLQFQADRHVLGFQPTKIYFAAFDHALSVEFLGTPGVTPQSSTGGVRASMSSTLAPLTRVTYTNLWQGITVTYDAVDEGIAKSTYLIAPGADVSQIQLRYNLPAEMQEDGSLRFDLPSTSLPSAQGRGYLAESPPVAWQEIAGARVPVSVMFSVSAENQVGFSVERYNPRYALVIDPVYSWHTFYGEGGADEGFGVAVDGSGNVYLAGYSTITWNGPSGQLPLHAHSSSGIANDIVVVKLNSSGAYQWHTFYGGSGLNYDEGMDIVADNSGNVYVLGQSTGTWNGPSGQTPLHSHTGGWDLVVLKLDGNGTYQWHTFIGSGDTEHARRIALDTSNNVYVLSDGDGCWIGPGGEAPLNACHFFDFAVSKLNSNGGYLWHTFYGSSTFDDAYGIAADSNGNVYVTGISDATWNGPSGQVPLHSHGGGWNLFALKLNSNGTYQWHTFYGSSSGDVDGFAIAVDGSGNSYVAGSSYATWNGPSGQSPLHAYSGSSDILVLKLNTNGAYQWHTFYGSGSTDGANAIMVDGSTNVYVAGSSYATWNGPSGQSPLHALSGVYDSAVLKLNSSGAYQWHTFYGSGSNDIAVDANGNVHVIGSTVATWNGSNGETPLHAVSGYYDIVVLKLNGGGTYQWHAFYGGASDEGGSGIAVDGSGNIYIVGQCNGLWIGSSQQNPLHYPSGGADLVVVKLNSSGQYQWHTCYGSSGEDSGTGIAVDGSGNVYVTGISSATWSGPNAEPPLHAQVGGGNPNRYVLKLSGSGAYQWHTFYGIWDARSAIVVDGSANVYVAGSSAGPWNGPLGQSPLHGYSGAGWDILVLKLNSSGAYQWHTFYGEIPGTDSLQSIALDASGNVYAVGSSDASWNGPSGQLPLHAYNLQDLWVLKLNSNGQYQWHTFYGSGGTDGAYAITVDGSSNVYVTGYSWATWNGPSGQSPLHAHSSSGIAPDLVVLKLNSGGVYQWHTFYGSSSGAGIAVDGSGNVYVTGYSDATWNGPSGQSPLHAYTGGNDILVLKLNNSGAYQSHTFYGSSSGDDSSSGIAVDGSGNVYVTGSSNATWQGDGSRDPLHAYSGGYDLVVLKLASSIGIYLPMVAKSNQSGPTPTPVPDVTLYVNNKTGADMTYEVLNTGCGQKTMAPGTLLYCTFPASTYTWQATAQCGSLSGTKYFPGGTQIEPFSCVENRPAGTLVAR